MSQHTPDTAEHPSDAQGAAVPDSALVATCFAVSALGLILLTSSGGNSTAAPDPAPQAQVQPVADQADALAQLGAIPLPVAPVVDPDFGAQVRAYLLENPEVIFEAVAAFEQRNAAAQADMDRAILDANVDALFNDGYSWIGGNPDGDVTLVKFHDYRCSFCIRAHDEIAELLEADDNVRLIIKEFPILGPESELAARFVIAGHMLGGPEAYAEFREILIRHDGAITEDFLDDVATDYGLDFPAISVTMASEDVTSILLQNRALAQRLQITGTPTFVMGDELIRGFVPADVLIETAAAQRN